MTTTGDTNLAVSFKLSGDHDCHTWGAARIKVDGRGFLTVYDAGSGSAESYKLADVQSFEIHPLSGAGKPM